MRPSLALQTHREAIRTIALSHQVTNVRVFGSVLTGDDHHLNRKFTGSGSLLLGNTHPVQAHVRLDRARHTDKFFNLACWLKYYDHS